MFSVLILFKGYLDDVNSVEVIRDHSNVLAVQPGLIGKVGLMKILDF